MESREKAAVMVLRIIGLTLTTACFGYWLVSVLLAIGMMSSGDLVVYAGKTLVLPLVMLGFTMTSGPLGRWAAGGGDIVEKRGRRMTDRDPGASVHKVEVFGEVFEQTSDGNVVRSERSDMRK